MVEDVDERRYLEARPGDSLICPFECDDCVFFRLERYWPKWDTPHEKYLGAFIRRANLDAFWALVPDTVLQNLRSFKEQTKAGKDYGFTAFDPIGPFPLNYDSGMRAALGILMEAQGKGHHEKFIHLRSCCKV